MQVVRVDRTEPSRHVLRLVALKLIVLPRGCTFRARRIPEPVSVGLACRLQSATYLERFSKRERWSGAA